MKNRIIVFLIASTFMMGMSMAKDAGEIDEKMGDSGITTENEKAAFYAAANKLKLPIVYYVDANGNMSKTTYAVELDLSKAVEGEALEFKVTNGPTKTDEYGCVLPETWHESMGHCFVQN